MAKGTCVLCKKSVGGMFSANAYICPACSKCYCKDCSDKKGLVFKDLISPCCGRVLKRI